MFGSINICTTFALAKEKHRVRLKNFNRSLLETYSSIAQLVRAPDC